MCSAGVLLYSQPYAPRYCCIWHMSFMQLPYVIWSLPSSCGAFLWLMVQLLYDVIGFSNITKYLVMLFCGHVCLTCCVLWLFEVNSCFIVPRHCFLGSLCLSIQGGPRKRGHRLMTIILSNLNRLKKISLSDSLVNLQLNGYLKSRCNLHMLLHYLVNL